MSPRACLDGGMLYRMEKQHDLYQRIVPSYPRDLNLFRLLELRILAREIQVCIVQSQPQITKW